MAYDKVIDSKKLEQEMTSVADAIREAGGTTEDLEWPQGYIDAITPLSAGGGESMEEWIDLANITTEEDVGYITFDKDVDGNPFSVKKLVMKVDLPSTIPASGLYVGTKKGLWGGAHLAINVATTALFICATIEVVEGKYTEIEMSQTKLNTYWGNLPNAKVVSSSSNLISQFYFGGAYSASMNNYIPTGTTIKVWGLKA